MNSSFKERIHVDVAFTQERIAGKDELTAALLGFRNSDFRFHVAFDGALSESI